jgi:hypothetical protein
MNTNPSNVTDSTVDRALLEERRRAMRREALECLAEADRLDALYAAVTATPGNSPHPDSNPNSDGGPI